MMIQFTYFAPAFVAIYAATGAWVFSCDPISKAPNIVRGGLLYGWAGAWRQHKSMVRPVYARGTQGSTGGNGTGTAWPCAGTGRSLAGWCCPEGEGECPKLRNEVS